jgi:hypothetical protein
MDMHDNPYAAPQAQVGSPPGNAGPTARSGKQLALDVLRGLRVFLIRGIPAAALSTCLFMMAGNVLDDGDRGAVVPLQPSAIGLFAFVGALAYFPAGLYAGVMAGLLRPRLRRGWIQHAVFSATVCVPIGLLAWMLLSVSMSGPTLDRSWLDPLFPAPFIPVPLLLWLFAHPQRVGHSVDPA